MKIQFNQLLIGAALIACGCSAQSEQCEVGAKGCACYPNRACDAGLECERETCRENDDSDSGGEEEPAALVARAGAVVRGTWRP